MEKDCRQCEWSRLGEFNTYQRYLDKREVFCCLEPQCIHVCSDFKNTCNEKETIIEGKYFCSHWRNKNE
jgi:hypothetical protein